MDEGGEGREGKGREGGGWRGGERRRGGWKKENIEGGGNKDSRGEFST